LTFLKRRKFLEKFAKDNNFNPLIPENWHSRLRPKVVATEVNTNGVMQDMRDDMKYKRREKTNVTQAGRKVLEFYNGNLQSALNSLFPEIGLPKSTKQNTIN
jgi:hypothetical protein